MVISLIIAALALWPTFSGAGDSRRALDLAEWTAKKDYFEFCELVCLDQLTELLDWQLPRDIVVLTSGAVHQ